MNKLSVLSIFLFTLLIFGANSVLAAEPDIVFSWKADSYAPSWFKGKIFPINQSEIVVSFEAISQNKSDFGKVLDLSSKNVKWFLDNKFFKEAKGLKSVAFTKDDFPSESMDVEIRFEIFDEDKNYTKVVSNYFSIPILSHHVIINHKKSDLFISLNEKINFKIIPFFFSDALENLTAKWRINGTEVVANFDNPFDLILNIASESPTRQVNVGGLVNNLNNQRESASKSILLKFY